MTIKVSRENALVDGKVAFPERSGKQPAIGEIWEVEVAGTNPSGKVAKTYQKNGKWSNSTYHCPSPQGTKTCTWPRSWEEGLCWPQASWKEAVAKFHENRQALVAFAHVAEPAPASTPEPGKIYFGFALADSMFVGDCNITRRRIPVDGVKQLVAQGVESCCNPSHSATIDAMRSRFGIDVSIPETPPRVALGSGDSVVVMGVRGLPRLTDRHEYTEEEIAQASFSFAMYTVA